MNDELDQARSALKWAQSLETDNHNNLRPEVLVNIALASALISLAKTAAKIELLLRQRLPK